MGKEIIKTNLKLSDKVLLKYNNRDVDMSLSDFKTFLDANLEPSSAVLTSSEPLKYKALLSQNAPIASTNNDTMVAGQIWELSGAANPSDYGTIDTFELISGTLYAAGSKYRVSINTPFTLSASAMEYDGSPYIVSTDVNGDLNPFVNTIGVNPILEYVTTGYGRLIFTGVNKTRDKIHGYIQEGADSKKTSIICVGGSSFTCRIFTYTLNATTAVFDASDDILDFMLVEVEIYF